VFAYCAANRRLLAGDLPGLDIIALDLCRSAHEFSTAD
jgi:hypothetical protein